MSTTAQTSDQASDRRTLSHVVNRLLQRQGGRVKRVVAEMRVGDYSDISQDDVDRLLEDGIQDGIYSVQQHNGEQVITAVNPVGSEPDVVSEAFGQQPTDEDLSSLSNVDAEIITALENECSVGSITELSGGDPETVAKAVNDHRDAQAPETDFEQYSFVSEASAQALSDAGYETLRDVHNADRSELASVNQTFTEAKAKKLREKAADNIDVFFQDQAAKVIHEAELQLPTHRSVAESSVRRFTARSNDKGEGQPRVFDVDEETDTVGEPLAIVDSEVDPTDQEAQYMASLGSNSDDPVPTGFQVLRDEGYDLIPRPETHPDAGDDALPVDENGDVVPPAVPTEPRLQLPLDEIIAKKLARGLDAPVRIEGPPGSGKNYTMKWLCWKTKRGYRSIDVGKTTTPDDLFGPITPDEDGVVTARNGAVKQGLLNGDIVVINEFPSMPAGVAMELHRLLNEGRLLVKAHGELITPHPAARIVITMNPPTREFRDTEPLNRATRGRFRGLSFPYPDTADTEVETLDQQANSGARVVSREDLRAIVDYARETRQKDSWPTLSTRNLTIVCEHIADGASPAAAVRNELWAVAEPTQDVTRAEETLADRF